MGNYAPNNYPPVNGLGLSSGHAGFGGGGGGGGWVGGGVSRYRLTWRFMGCYKWGYKYVS